MDELRINPNMLYLDSTRTGLNPASGYYEVTTSGELGSALGWEQGDLLLSVNDHGLQGFDAVLDAYLEVEDSHRFTLDLEREGVLVSLTYSIE